MTSSITSYKPDDLAYFQEEFVEPLRKLGFTFSGIGGIVTHDKGAHILFFEFDEDRFQLPIDGSIRDQLDSICIKDDDPTGGLYSCWQMYLGSLWVFIPFTA